MTLGLQLLWRELLMMAIVLDKFGYKERHPRAWLGGVAFMIGWRTLGGKSLAIGTSVTVPRWRCAACLCIDMAVLNDVQCCSVRGHGRYHHPGP